MEGQDSSTEICGPKTFRVSDRKHQTMPEALRTVRHGAGKPTGDLGYSTPGRPHPYPGCNKVPETLATYLDRATMKPVPN